MISGRFLAQSRNVKETRSDSEGTGLSQRLNKERLPRCVGPTAPPERVLEAALREVPQRSRPLDFNRPRSPHAAVLQEPCRGGRARETPPNTQLSAKRCWGASALVKGSGAARLRGPLPSRCPPAPQGSLLRQQPAPGEARR